jgi:hypothetical protein
MAESPSQLDWPALLHEALTAPGQVGATYNRFYPYSFTNQMYLRLQGVREPVATYRRWQAIGRQVLKGAHAKQIIRPVVVTVETEAGETLEQVTGFAPFRGIFALSDTVGPDLPPVQLPGWDRAAALAKLGVRLVPFDELNGNVQGYSRKLDIALNPVAVHPEKTLMHELGHVVLGHTMPQSLAEYATHRGIFEFQAESTAYLTMHELGQLDAAAASASRGYIQEWLDGERPPERAIQQVFTATDRILKAGRLTVGAVAEAALDERNNR